MIISREEALSLLRKWQGERRAIQVGLISFEKTGAHMLGRIEELTESSLRIDARSIRQIGFRNGLVLDLSDARAFRFEDWRDAKPEFAEQLRDAFEAFLFIDLGECHCELYAAKTRDELPPIKQS